MINLSQIGDYLLNNFTNINVELLEPLSYIQTLAKPTGKLLLLYKQSIPVRKHEISEIHNIETETSNFDLTGTPLEDDFDITLIDICSVDNNIKINPWRDEEEKYSTLNVDMATNIINILNMDKTNTCDSGSVFIICDGDGMNNCKQFMLNIQYDKDLNWRGTGTFTGLIPFNEIDLSILIKQHLTGLRDCNKVDTTIATFFNIKSNQTIKLSWVTTSLTPSIKYNKNADVILSQVVAVSNYDSSIGEFWRQLEIMDGIEQAIVKYKKRENSKDLVYDKCASSLSLSTIKEHIVEVLSNIPPFEMPKETDTFDVSSVILRMKSQRILNVTDQLWNVLKFCSSYKDLLNSLHYIFQCAAQSIVVNMPTSKSRLACIIRKISEKSLEIPRLSGSEPLEILLEIGLEKISKDYEHIFAESKICSSMSFQMLIQDNSEACTTSAPLNVRKTLQHAAEGPRKTLLMKTEKLNAKGNAAEFDYSHFDKAEVERKLTKFGQIHLILEHIILMQVNLNLDNTVFGPIMNNLPTQGIEFSRLSTMKYDKQNFRITTNKIFSIIENQKPQTIEIFMKSENRFKVIENTFYFSTNPICPPNIFPYMWNNAELNNEEILYCGLHYTKMGSKKK